MRGKIFETIPGEIQQYLEVRKLARAGQYRDATERLNGSSLSESTRKHLQTVLASGDRYVVGRTLDEIDGRLGQALCWDCWRS